MLTVSRHLERALCRTASNKIFIWIFTRTCLSVFQIREPLDIKVKDRMRSREKRYSIVDHLQFHVKALPHIWFQEFKLGQFEFVWEFILRNELGILVNIPNQPLAKQDTITSIIVDLIFYDI